MKTPGRTGRNIKGSPQENDGEKQLPGKYLILSTTILPPRPENPPVPPTAEGHGNSLGVDKTSTAPINNSQPICPLLFSSKDRDNLVPCSDLSFYTSLSLTGVSGIRKDFVWGKKRKERAQHYYSSSPSRGKFLVDQELLEPCSTARQGHGNHGGFCRKSWNV